MGLCWFCFPHILLLRFAKRSLAKQSAVAGRGGSQATLFDQCWLSDWKNHFDVWRNQVLFHEVFAEGPFPFLFNLGLEESGTCSHISKKLLELLQALHTGVSGTPIGNRS